MAAHNRFRDLVEEHLSKEGYVILGREVQIKDIVINGTYIIVDLLVGKDGKTIPVECGNNNPATKKERIEKLRLKYGAYLHFRWGYRRNSLLKKEFNIFNKITI